MLELDAGGGCRELPVGLGVIGVAVVLPGGYFFDEGLFIGYAAVEALGGQHAEFGLRQIEPAAMLWRVVPFEALNDGAKEAETDGQETKSTNRHRSGKLSP